MNRLRIKEAVIKQLFALSGNQCAFPECGHYLVRNGRVEGEICHIVGAKEKGPRNDPSMSEEQRRDFSNLILMCRLHHEQTHDENKYSAETMRKYKYDHEERWSGQPFEVSDDVVQTIIHNYYQSFSNSGPGQQINVVDSPHANININQVLVTTVKNNYKTLDDDFWRNIAQSEIDPMRFLLNLHSEESVICKAILDGIVSEVDCHFEDENFFERIEWDITEKLKNKKGNLFLILSPPGSGKTTLLYMLAHKFKRTTKVIRLSTKLDRPLGFIAQNGIILIDEIRAHKDLLESYYDYLVEAFPDGFILLVAEQNVIWDQLKDRNHIVRRYYEHKRISVLLRTDQLNAIFGRVATLIEAGGSKEELGKLRKAFIKIGTRDTRTVADRLIDLYHRSGITQKNNNIFRKPDWDTLEEIGDPGLTELYCLTAFMNSKNEYFDLRLIQDNLGQYTTALKIITDSRDGSYPIELTDNNTLRLRHFKLANWFFLENERKKGLAELFFRNKIVRQNPGPEVISVLRHLYQADKSGTLKFLYWSEDNYYDFLYKYYLANREHDIEQQAQKCLQESLKVLFQINRVRYESAVVIAAQDALNSTPSNRRWLAITVTRNQIRIGDYSAAHAALTQLSDWGFVPTELQDHHDDIEYYRLMRQLSLGNLSEEDIQGLSQEAIQRLARELGKEQYRTLRHRCTYLLARYFAIGKRDEQLTQREYEALLASYCNRLLSDKEYLHVFRILDNYAVNTSPLLQAFLGFALLHQPSGPDPAAVLKGKELIINSFFLDPTNPSAVHYLSFILNKDRVSFTEHELSALKTKITDLHQFGSHAMYFKVLSDITRRMNDTAGVIGLLRQAVSKQPDNDSFRFFIVKRNNIFWIQFILNFTICYFEHID